MKDAVLSLLHQTETVKGETEERILLGEIILVFLAYKMGSWTSVFKRSLDGLYKSQYSLNLF
jgi:hypothetical protein